MSDRLDPRSGDERASDVGPDRGETPPSEESPGDAGPLPLRGRDLFTAWWRLFHLQAILAPDRMQGPGFAFAMLSLLRRLYPDRERFGEAMARHTSYVATHPLMAGYVLGAAARLESGRAAGEPIDGERIDGLKRALASPLAAIGDPFFWVSLRPVAGLVGVLGIAIFGPADPTRPDLRVLLCPLLLLLTYNAVALPVRWRGIAAGLALAESPAALLRSVRLGEWRDVVERGGAFLYGALLALALAGLRAATGGGGGGLASFAAALAPLALGFIAARLVLRRTPSATVESALLTLTLAALASLAL
jgi:mannose/fructose/N-acetylgalactosamine-specific phosphotransferase system component IID